MGSISSDSPFLLEVHFNQEVDVAQARVLEINMPSSGRTSVLALTLTEKATAQSIAMATTERLYKDLRSIIKNQREGGCFEIPRTWVLLDLAAGHESSRMNAESISEFLLAFSSVSCAEKQFWIIVAEVLQVSPKKVCQAVTFSSIGGTASSAVEIHTRCLRAGILLPTADLLSKVDLQEVALGCVQVLEAGCDHPSRADIPATPKNATEARLWSSPVGEVTEFRCLETDSALLKIELSGSLAPIGTEPFPVRKTLALLLHATLLSFRQLQPDRENLTILVKNYYTGNHQQISVCLRQLGHLDADLLYFGTLLEKTELRPAASLSGTAELILQYEEGNLCDRANEPREPEDATACLPSLFLINIHKESTRISIEFQTPKIAHKDNQSNRWLNSFKAVFDSFTISSDATTAFNFWTEKLKDPVPAVFPTRSTAYARAETATATVNIPSKRCKETRSILQSAWAVILGRYNDSIDVCFDTSVRPRGKLPFENGETCPYILPMQVELNGDARISLLLDQVSQHNYNMSFFAEHGASFISALDVNSRAARRASSALIIDTAENLQAISATMSEKMSDSEQYPLVIHAVLAESEVQVKLVYNTYSIGNVQCVALVNQIQHVIEQLLRLEDKNLGSVSVAGSWDLKQAMEFNGPPKPIYHQCIHHLIAEHTRRDPEHEAIYATDSSTTYYALEKESTMLAAHIECLGIPPRTVIPVCFASCKWAIVAMIGVMKAGCTVMPLDPSHPESRRQMLVERVGATTIIASPKTVATCQTMCANVVVLDENFIAENTEETQGTTIPLRECQPADVAFLLFTSGSTGIPKGVPIEHSAASTSILNFAQKQGATRDTRLLSIASYAFDACIYEIFIPLLVGGTVCVPPEEQRLENISPFLAEARITDAIFTPSYLKTLDIKELPTLQTIMIAGEPATLDVVEAWQSRVRLMNCYGPTEACVCVSTYTYEQDFYYTTTTKIGDNVHGNYWIVEPDNHHRLTPIGCTGELVVQSHAMAREYYKSPEKTAASFVNNLELFPPSSPMRTALCYKTGDLVKYNTDGTLEYQGRKDSQIKIRGHRLEPAEIEHLLTLGNNRIQSSAVHMTKRKAASYLVAFVDFKEPLEAARTENMANSDPIPLYPAMEELLTELRGYLAVRLPKYMVPSFVVPLKEIPFLTSLKIDRKRLQGLADSLAIEELSKYSAATSGTEIEAPTIPEEIAMRDLWAIALNIDPTTIGRESSFLHIGGDSISAIYLSSLARQQGLELPTATIFRDSRLSVLTEIAKPILVNSDKKDEVTKPFSLLRSGNIDTILPQLRTICGLADGEIIDDAYPCTPLQEGLLALSVKYPGSYIAKFVYRLGDDIDIVRFKAAWQKLSSTRESLRVRIAKIGTNSIQTLVQHDFAWEPTTGMSLIEFLEVAQNMNMSYGSKLSRSALIKEASGRMYFVLVTHHAVFDGWAMTLILNALKQMYQGTGSPSFVPYSGFVKYASSLDVAKARAYWKQQLRGAQPPTFPTRQINSAPKDTARKVTRIIKHDISFPDSTSTTVTKGTILRAAWALVLARYGNTSDVVLGATASGRNANVEGISSMTGAVIGTVPVRVQVDSNKTIREFLVDIQNQAMDMVPYEQFGFQNIAKISAEAKAASDVTSLLIVQPQQQVEAIENDTSAFMTLASPEEYSLQDTIEGYFTFPIVLQCLVYADHITLDFTYDSTIVLEPQMKALCRHFENISNQLLTQDDSKLGDVEMAGAWDLEQATSFNRHVQEVVADECLHSIISQRAAESPDNQALYSTDTCMTYAELEQATSLLACHLMELGVRQETVVPLCFEKSTWTVIAMLGIMKAGGVFMPLDPAHPYDRRKALIEQVGAQYILTSAESASSCEKISKNVVILSKALLEELKSTKSLQTATFKSDPSSAAYILFTSGSTGQPKGIVVEHRAICSSMISHGREFGLSSSSRVLQFASYVFDVSVSEILTTLVFGGTVCIPTGLERMQNIAEFINRAQTDVAMLTPSFVTTFSPKDVPSLKVLILGGEAPTKLTLGTWQPHVRLLNGYAPAECCIYALTHTYQSTDEVPTILGNGIHTNCWIVEPENHNRLAPIGCVGELVIQGNTIGRGYVHDPEKTSKAFLNTLDCIPKQLQKPYHRFYKSGDLVKYDVNGNIEYLGRKDTQVKLRGQRIELGEIEFNIQQSLKDVKYATVEVVRRGQREALVAFISFADTDNDASEELLEDGTNMIRENTPEIKRKFDILTTNLQAKLPPFMVPSVFIALRRTPFLSSMKVNRKLLRGTIDAMSPNEYSQLSIQSKDGSDTSMSQMELKLRDMWAEILYISPELIGREDGFFQIGGDSIAALQLLSMAHKQGIIISMSTALKNPTLTAMAEAARQDDTVVAATLPFELLERTQAGSIIQDACEQCDIRSQRDVEDIFPCTPFQEGLVALSIRQPGAYVSTIVYNLATGTPVLRLKAAWERTVERCSNLRTRIIIPSSSSDGKAFQLITTFKPSWENTIGHDLASFVALEKENHMGYGSVLCRYALLEGPEPYFVLTIHHAMYDLWSMHLILSTLREAYDGAEELPVLQHSAFVKYIVQTDVAKTQQYWREQLNGVKPVTFPRLPLSQKKKKAVMREKTTQIAMPSFAKTNITKAALVQAAWGIVLARHSESDDICYGTTVTGRLANLPGITSMTGPTITTVPFRCKINHGISVSKFLEQVQERTTSMIPHEQYGILNIAKLGADAKAACDFSTLLIIQPTNQVASLASSQALLVEDTTDATKKLLEDGLQSYFDNPLVINCVLTDDNVQLVIYYDSNILTGASLEAIEHHFGYVMEQLARQDDTPIGSISLLDKWDMELAVSSQKIPEPNFSCTNWLVEKQMELHPHRAAICAWDGDLSYSQLSMAAADLASRLRSKGIGSNDLVLTAFGKSKWSVVAMIAVQLAGAAIVPVELDTMKYSQQVILATVKPTLILTTSYFKQIFEASGVETMPVDTIQMEAVEHFSAVPQLPPTPEGLSLVLLTDEDSAEPNGLKFTHTAVSSSVLAYSAAIRLDKNVRMLQYAPTGSLLGIFEVLSTLSTGGCVCIPQEDIEASNLAKVVDEFQATAVLVNPSIITLLEPEQLPTLKLLGLNCEAVTKTVLEKWAATIDTHSFSATKESLMFSYKKINFSQSSNMIGSPVSAAFWIVEDNGVTQLTPLGCMGELVVEGPSLSQGYLRATSQTVDNFIEDLGCLPGATARRVFRTGDLVQRNFDGSLEYIGRKEFSQQDLSNQMALLQVESQLCDCLPESMKGTVARLEETSSNAPVGLVWYTKSPMNGTVAPVLLEHPSAEILAVLSELHSFLTSMLPKYLVPASFLLFNGPPSQLTSGRYNRREIVALANKAPIEKRIATNPGNVFAEEPVTLAEYKLRELWAAVLSIPVYEIGRNDNFLSIGGDSISAIQLVTMARHQGMSLNVASIFKDARLSEVAASAIMNDNNDAEILEPFALLPDTPSDYLTHEVKKQCGLGQSVLIEDMYPCTKLQEGLMALTASNANSYVAHHAFRLGDDVDVESFKVAWEHTVDISAVLRTRIVPINGTFMQVVVKNDISWEDASCLDVKQYVARDSKIPMGYGSKLSRYAIVASRYFVWTMHHAAADGWTMGLLLDRATKIYRRIQTPEARPFTSFIRYTMTSDKKSSTEYWSKQLQGATRTAFPPDSMDSSTPSATFSRIIQHTPPTDSSITMATILRSAWSILLGVYCGTNDVCFGSVSSGRQAPLDGIEYIAGPTIASVPVRIVIPAEKTIRDFLREVQEQTADMIPHEQYGLQNIAKINFELRDACQFSNMMVIQPRSFGGSREAADAIAERLEWEASGGVNDEYYTYPLVLRLLLMDSGFEVSISYAPELLSEHRVTALTYQLEHVVSQLLGSTDRLVKDVSVSGLWDLQQAVTWNPEDITTVNHCMHDFFTEHVSRYSSREAVYTSSRILSYGELDKMSTQLAVYLQGIGVGPEVIVPFCMEKSIWPTVCVVAIMKAGGAFMPMDPTHPFEYRQAIVKQASASIVLVSSSLTESCQGLAERVIPVSDSLDCFSSSEIDAKNVLLRNQAGPHNPVYVIFSSGSTGLPKGIVIEHRAFASSMTGHGQRLGFCRETRTFQFANHVWDVAVFDILTTLAYGGTICVPTEYERLHSTVQFVNESRSNMALLTPSFMRTIDPDLVPTMTTITSGGEALTRDILAAWVNKARLFDVYGPAEASVVAAIHHYKSTSESPGTIGIPVHNANWIVDQDHPGRLAPIGCAGELVIQGPAVARGYLNNPSLTDQSFSSSIQFLPEHLIAKSPKFYFTGDLVKYNDNGEMLYLGRRDAQVKLRGQRMELGHIETRIKAASDEIESAVVEIMNQGTPAVALVGLVKLKESCCSSGLDEGLLLPNTDTLYSYFCTLKEKLAGVLPGYMIPGHFISLSVVPKNRAAKTDRRLLRKTVEALSVEKLKTYSVSARGKFCSVANKTERQIRDAWATVLRLNAEEISTNDNFYDIGGDSIAIITLLKIVKYELGVHLGLSMVNSKRTTIAQMAKFISTEAVNEPAVDVREEIESLLSSPWFTNIHAPGFVSSSSLPNKASVFLTGATGFLGTQLLRGLLAMDNVERVVALVRAESAEKGLERVAETARVAGWWDKEHKKRIQVWTGDLEKARLGLKDEEWKQLSGASSDGKIDAIIHNGAIVNWNADYDKLMKANVQSVVDLLRAAVESRHGPRFVFISGGASTDLDADPTSAQKEMNNSIGYCQTKYVAETLVHRLAKELPPSQNRFSVVKPGMVIGTAAEGVANLDDFLWRFVAAAARIQSYPMDDAPSFVPVSDGGLIAALTLGQLHDKSISAFVNISNKVGLASAKFWTLVNSELETPCQPTPWAAWLERALQDMDETGESHPLWPVQYFVAEGGISKTEVLSVPDTSDLECAVRSNVRYLQRVGFINSSEERILPRFNGAVLRRGLFRN